jgi:predicted acyl esterase
VPVRQSELTTPLQKPVANVVFPSYPPKATTTKFYLGPNGGLSSNPVKDDASASYLADVNPKEAESAAEEITFSHKFTTPTWLVGYSWLVVHVSSEQDDIDVFVQVQKLDASGKALQCMNIPLDELVPAVKDSSEVANSCFLKYNGPSGVLRASHAGTKVSSPDAWPEYRNDSQKAIEPGTVVRLEIPIWPTSISFKASESLAVKVAGHYMGFMEFEALNGASHKNKGKQTIYYGGQYDSHLVVPLMGPVTK